LYSIY